MMPSDSHGSHVSHRDEPLPIRDLNRQAHDPTGALTRTNHPLQREVQGRKHWHREILAITEKERRRIGQELHDSIGQQLTGIVIMSQVLEQKLERRHVPEAADAGEIARMVRQALAETRQLSRALYPADLDEHGLISALNALAAATQNVFRVRCTLDCRTPGIVLDNSVAVHVYRIVQEAITNAVRHGQARNIRIALASTGDCATLAVSNDGLAFPKDLPRDKGIGLQVMRHRAEMIDGTLTVKPGLQGGTEVVCVFATRTQPRTGETEQA
jgi:signal transduction histidine kinase